MMVEILCEELQVIPINPMIPKDSISKSANFFLANVEQVLLSSQDLNEHIDALSTFYALKNLKEHF
jgi:hypothetical protein